MASHVDRDLEGYGRELARGDALGQRRALAERYTDDLDANSHGESFLQFFRARFTSPGLYLLDEPDTALSPQSTLGLMTLVKDMVDGGAQLIIATHSPMLLAFPEAAIVSFDHTPIGEVGYDEVAGVRLIRSFQERPDAFVRGL